MTCACWWVGGHVWHAHPVPRYASEYSLRFSNSSASIWWWSVVWFTLSRKRLWAIWNDLTVWVDYSQEPQMINKWQMRHCIHHLNTHALSLKSEWPSWLMRLKCSLWQNAALLCSRESWADRKRFTSAFEEKLQRCMKLWKRLISEGDHFCFRDATNRGNLVLLLLCVGVGVPQRSH